MDSSTISAALDVARSSWGLLTYLRRVAGADVISAYFKYDGTRIEGSAKIQVERHPHATQPEVWWYSVAATEDYVFLREPVTPSCALEAVGTLGSEPQPDARYWRWVAPVLPGRTYGAKEPPNLKVDFLVFGYRPAALLQQSEGR
jgi:hypothetical protein